MALDYVDFNNLVAADLLRLIENGIAEGRHIEYKRDAIGYADKDKKEFLKDVSSFANSAGGHVVIGMRAVEGVAAELVGVEVTDRDAEVQRLDNMIRDNLEPRAIGVHVKSVGVADGRCAFVVHVPRSWNPPHRVNFKNMNKFFARNSNGAHEVSVEELRALFTVSGSVAERVRDFRTNRVNMIRNGQQPVPVRRDGGFLVIHIVPLVSLSDHGVDIRAAYQEHQRLRPIAGEEGMTARYNFDGLLITSGGRDGGYLTYVQLLRNGCVEAVCGDRLRLHEGYQYLSAGAFETRVVEVLPSYCDALSRLQIDLPYVVMVSLLDVGGSLLGEANHRPEPRERLQQGHLLMSPIILETSRLEGEWHSMLRPVFDEVWNAYGFAGSRYFDAEGRWRPAR